MKKAEKLILGNIITMDDTKPYAEAVVVTDGIITYVGGKKTAKTLCDENTTILDYGENYVYPGFMEGHAHGLLAGWREIGIANVMPGNSYAEYISLMADYVNSNPGKNFYMGSGWIEKESGDFTKENLDAIRSDVPIVLQSNDGHSMLLNSKALEKYNITAETAKKMTPGEVDFDESGEPNGLIHETPVKDIMSKVPMTFEELMQYILKWQEIAFEHGFTAHAEAGSALVTQEQNAAYTHLANEGKLKIRTYSYHTVLDNTDTPEEDVEKTFDIMKNNNEYHKVIGIKGFFDGVLEARTAWMINEYSDQPGYYGVPCFNDHDKLVRLIKAAAKYNISIHFHSMGDAATKFFLDCVEEAQAETGNMDQRNCLAHLEFIAPEDFKRFADTNTIAITAPTWTMKLEDNYNNAVKYVGKETMDEEYPIKSLFDTGTLVVAHSDYSAGPFLDIPLSIFMACNRYYPDLGTESLNNPKECVTRKQAILMMTKNIAKQFHEEDRLGSLEIGKIANMSVFDKDFLNCPDEDIMKANLIATVIDGDEVFGNN